MLSFNTYFLPGFVFIERLLYFGRQRTDLGVLTAAAHLAAVLGHVGQEHPGVSVHSHQQLLRP